MQRDDARMRKLPDHPRFLEKTLPRFALRQLRREQFNGYVAPDQRVKPPHDAAVSAFAEHIQNLVPTHVHGGLSFSFADGSRATQRACSAHTGAYGRGLSV